ncbi:MAG: sigma-70 family RNA polymerase sigma factor [Actinobacteria bacterium]|nr:sigma-70 family RNA polymerase sigma factor [Actinomycetota bacterium]
MRVALSLTRSTSDAEDLVQETMLRAFRAIDRFDGRHPRAWLLTILRNVHLNSIRRRRPDLLRDPDTDVGELDPTVWASSAESVVIDQTFDGVVELAFRSLSGELREVVSLVDVQGMTYAEAAATMGTPVGKVMSRLHRARARIRVYLAEARVTQPKEER